MNWKVQKVEKGSPQKTNSLTINMSREFVLTATTVSPFCTTFPAIAESPLSKRHLWSTPYRMDRVPRRSRSLGRGEKSAQTQLTSGIHRELWYSSTRNGSSGEDCLPGYLFHDIFYLNEQHPSSLTWFSTCIVYGLQTLTCWRGP